ncbi:hypothetical protein [Neorhodopirellula pilleata]|uniref:Uncharacterized protein n=1 Tax=Neorhodopirellula pilleata TaxID=2714738 RepID=A0A5C6A720_9BACT|nr:hypothetical protein [Neorhodopirellula pilleata]TWT94143.1 hypothetical protein Pla100_37510 [Neorhodopirellula pilleata]
MLFQWHQPTLDVPLRSEKNLELSHFGGGGGWFGCLIDGRLGAISQLLVWMQPLLDLSIGSVDRELAFR